MFLINFHYFLFSQVLSAILHNNNFNYLYMCSQHQLDAFLHYLNFIIFAQSYSKVRMVCIYFYLSIIQKRQKMALIELMS